jgi:HlyD family secretion protein/epimerase transport system membrane fusion protein
VLIQKELVAVEEMVEKEYMPVSDLYALQREAARLKGNSDERLALISRARQSIGETDLQIIQNEHERRAEVLKELRDTRNQLAELEEQMRASSDVLQRTLIVAPRTGKIMNLRVHTLGGIIRPGDTLMTIIPKQDNLVVEARINPLDIDVVEIGLPVKVQLTAYKMRDTPTLKGVVTQVSGDVLQDDATGERYYLTRIVIDARALSDEALLTLYPGMPVNVMIVVDTRSLFSYLLAPLKASFTRAFNEQ